MHTSANNTEVNSQGSKSWRGRGVVPIVLIIVVLASLFSLSSNNENNNSNPKLLAVMDSPGASPSGPAWCQSQAWVNVVLAHRAAGDGLYKLFEFLDWQTRMGSAICPSRPDNPSISLKCTNPQITVALLVDRSNSVVADGTSATPNIFKRSINTLIDEFYAKFTPSPRNGTINFLVYAFGTKSVLQNDTTDNKIPVLASNLITDASTPTGRADLLDTISKIHFRDEDVPSFRNKNLPNSDKPGFQHADGSIYQRQRAYNLGTESNGGEYGQTNWQDALISVMDAGSSSKYNNPGPAGVGKRIDLAVMVTDGLPTADDGGDWTWTPGTFRGTDTISYNPAADGVDKSNASDVSVWNSQYGTTDDLYRITTESLGLDRAKKAVDMLRTGANPRDSSSIARSISERPPISVKAIVITTNPDSSARNKSRSYASDVFGPDNFFFATDFTSTLEDQIKSLVTNVIDESGCPSLNTPVKPGLSITADTGSLNASGNALVTPTEGDSAGQRVTYTVANSATGGELENVVVCIGTNSNVDYSTGTPKCTDGTIYSIAHMNAGESVSFDYFISVPLGGSVGDFKVVAAGKSLASEDDLIDPSTGLSYSPFPTGDEDVAVDPGRVSMPS